MVSREVIQGMEFGCQGWKSREGGACSFRWAAPMVVAVMLAVGTSLAYAHVDHVETEPSVQPADHPDVEALEAYFAEAARDYDVPIALLHAVAFVESRWVHAGPTVDYGYGLMHLVANADADTLAGAAAVSGYTVEQLKTDPRANIRGAAALLAEYTADTVDKPAGLEGYAGALARLTGLRKSVQSKQVAEYYRVLADGADAINGLGMRIVLAPAPVDRELAVGSFETADQESTDYGPAIWNPADASNYSAYRSGGVDRWVNHWVGVGSYAGAISWFQNPTANVSAHFVIRQSDGELTQMVRFAHTAWHCGNWNYRSIGIEHEATPSYPWPTSPTAPMLVNSAAACRYVCDLYGLPRTRTYIIGHQEVPGSYTDCPGPLPWDTYMALVNDDLDPPGPLFSSRLTNGGFEDDFNSWVELSGTTVEIPTSGAHRGNKCCKFYNTSGYATIWQNPSEIMGETWRTTAWAYVGAGMADSGVGFKDQSGNTEAMASVVATGWTFHSVDYVVADDVDAQAWGTGGGGVYLDDVRCGQASKMNWITGWLVNGTHAADLNTDFFAAEGGEAGVLPAPGLVQAGHTWTEVARPDGFIDLDDAMGGDVSSVVTYAHVYVTSDADKTVNLVVGADDGLKVFLNGQVVHTNDADSGHDYFAPDEEMIEDLTLWAGVNRLMIKVRENSGDYSFSARFADDDGHAIQGLTFSILNSGEPVDQLLIESRSGGQNHAWYSEEGVWADNANTSGAAGVTAGIGSRYGSTYRSVAGLKKANFTPTLTAPGQWHVYATWPAAINRRGPILHRVVHAGGVAEIDVDQAGQADMWYDLGAYTFNAGTGGYVQVSNENIDLSGSMYAGAVRFVKVGSEPVPPAIETAVSRKSHGVAGDFDVDCLAVNAIETREGGPTQVVVTFDKPVQALAGDTSDVTLSSGTISGVTVAGDTVTIAMSGAADQYPLTVGFPGIADAGDVFAVVEESVCVVACAGDVNGSGIVDIFDLLDVRNRLGQAVGTPNWFADVRADGQFDIFDLLSVRNRLTNIPLGLCP